MAAILQSPFSENFLEFEFRFNFHWILVLKNPIDNKSALVQIMDWHLTGDKPLSEPMTPYFSDAYMSLDLNELTEHAHFYHFRCKQNRHQSVKKLC